MDCKLERAGRIATAAFRRPTCLSRSSNSTAGRPCRRSGSWTGKNLRALKTLLSPHTSSHAVQIQLDSRVRARVRGSALSPRLSEEPVISPAPLWAPPPPPPPREAPARARFPRLGRGRLLCRPRPCLRWPRLPCTRERRSDERMSHACMGRGGGRATQRGRACR